MKRRAVYACVDCGAPKAAHQAPLSQRCGPCSSHFYRVLRSVNAIVSKAKKHGALAPAAGQDCVDCGGPARDLEHRDYSKPLDVVPVCRACNFKRGPAAYPRRADLPATEHAPGV